MDLKALEDGIPDEAYKPLSGDEKTVCASLKRRTRCSASRTRQDRCQNPSAPAEPEAGIVMGTGKSGWLKCTCRKSRSLKATPRSRRSGMARSRSR